MKLLGLVVFGAILTLALAKTQKRPEHEEEDRGCSWQLCNASRDMEYCKVCGQGLIDEGILPEKELFECIKNTKNCRDYKADDLAILRECMTNASARLGECIALPEDGTGI
ncbi:uncharacterized protein LOC122263205 [Penaeus japonicus]|uniref:uncharacterized protein LOC122263205 n=1 Tax=Penaeus japonicus TaxID=27405 RepID=UPI001C716FEC|nr:uncharacterized protein LOC122263205 [Penaeus japonicus]